MFSWVRSNKIQNMKMVNKIAAFVLLLTSTTAFAQEKVTFSGKIENQNSDSLFVANRTGFTKTIKLSSDGTFSDSFEATEGFYIFMDGTERGSLYLKNGYDLKMTLDANEFDESLKFEGKGAASNNYLAGKVLLQQGIGDIMSIFELEKEAYEAEKNKILKKYQDYLDQATGLEEALKVQELQQLEGSKQQFDMMFESAQALAKMTGQASPEFNNYENHAGGETSLSDFKGKYVYIDLWATWCGPCIAEIPSLKKVEEKYHGRNIAFVSISIDQPNAYEKWKSMVTEKEMTGVQLYAKGDQKFAGDYQVRGIPRFILIDPEGKVVKADAPRPSSGKLIELLDKLGV